MGQEERDDLQDGFGGGLNLIAAKSKVADNEMVRAENVHLTTEGAFRSRYGVKRLHPSTFGAYPVYGTSFRPASGSTEIVMANGTLYKAPYSDPISSWASIGGGFNTGIARYAHFRDGTGEVLYVAHGASGIGKTDGTTRTATIAGTPTGISQLAVYNSRLYGITGSDQKVYASALNNGDTLGIGASGGIEAVVWSYGGQRIVGLAVLGKSLLLFHQEAISRFTGLSQDDVAVETGTAGVSAVQGTVAPNSIVVIEADEGGTDLALFLTSQGLYQATEGGIQFLSNKIQPALQLVDQTLWSRATGVLCKQLNEVWFYIPDQGIYAWNYRLNAWSGPMSGAYTTSQCRSMWQSYDSQGQPIVLLGGADGYVRQAEYPSALSDDILSDGSGGSSIPWAVQCRRFYFRSEAETKSPSRIYVTGQLNGSRSASYSWQTQRGSGQKTIDSGAVAGSVWGGFVWGLGRWGSSSESKTYRRPLAGQGGYLDITLSDDTAGVVIEMVRASAFILGRL